MLHLIWSNCQTLEPLKLAGNGNPLPRLCRFRKNNKAEEKIQAFKAGLKEILIQNSADHYMVRVNWLYRPKDISKRTSDSRVLYATMNSDICPLASIRGRCNVTHRDHIKDIEEYRCKPDNFTLINFMIATLFVFRCCSYRKIINIPAEAQEVLCRRFKYAVVEIGRGKELCAAPKIVRNVHNGVHLMILFNVRTVTSITICFVSILLLKESRVVALAGPVLFALTIERDVFKSNAV